MAKDAIYAITRSVIANLEPTGPERRSYSAMKSSFSIPKTIHYRTHNANYQQNR